MASVKTIVFGNAGLEREPAVRVLAERSDKHV